MTHLVIVIMDDLEQLPNLLSVWRKIGVSGVTIMQSAGAYRTEHFLSRVGLGAIDRLFDSDEVSRRTLLAVIKDEDLLGRAVAEADRAVGGFDQPETGVLLVIPVAEARGLRKTAPPAPEEIVAPPPELCLDWLLQRDTPIDEVAAILDLEPTVVPSDMPLNEVAKAMLDHPNVHIACVVGEGERLVGLLRLRAVADDIFFHVMPEEFLSHVTDLDEAIEYASTSRLRTAADAMQEPVWVQSGETVKDAFKRMHEHALTGLPVVDDQYRVVNYINLLELLAVRCETIAGSPCADANADSDQNLLPGDAK